METGINSAAANHRDHELVSANEIQKDTAAETSANLKTSRPAWRRWIWALVAGYIVLQTYYVREMLAALLLFTALFAIVAVIGTVIYIVGRAGEAGIELAEPAAKRGIVLAEELSKKTFHRPRSAPVP